MIKQATSLFVAIFFSSSVAFLSSAAVAKTPAGAIVAQAKPVTLATLQPQRKKFGALLWKGGLRLSSEDPRFGGFSGLALSKDGKRFIAISDRARWLKGQLVSKDGILQDVQNLHMAELDVGTRRKSFAWRDSESLAPWDARGIDGSLLIGFERRERILSYRYGQNQFPSRPKLIKQPKGISTGPGNGELEAIGRFYSGPRKNWLIAVSERNFDSNGNIKSWLWRGYRTIAFSLERFEDYDVTDLAVLPDGKSFVTLERSFNLPNLPGFAIRKFNLNDLKRGKTVKGEILFSGRQPFFSIDNMEGIAVHKAENGRVQLTLISDDNFNRSLQRTLIFRFEMKE